MQWMLAQEPAPVQAGVAPHEGIYAPGVDAVHYDVEIGVGKAADWVGGRVTIKVAVETDAPILPLDFTGMNVFDVKNSVNLKSSHGGTAIKNIKKMAFYLDFYFLLCFVFKVRYIFSMRKYD